MPDKYGQLLPGEEEQGLEEGDLSDYLMPLKGAGKKLISRLIKRGVKTKPNKPSREATPEEQERTASAYKKNAPPEQKRTGFDIQDYSKKRAKEFWEREED